MLSEKYCVKIMKIFSFIAIGKKTWLKMGRCALRECKTNFIKMFFFYYL